MHQANLSCPSVGHKTFEKALSKITIGDAETKNQLSKFIRPALRLHDPLGMQHQPGELQKLDVAAALPLFEHRRFIAATLTQYANLFQHSECRVYQFQTITSTGTIFVFGTLITDHLGNLIDYCVDSSQAEKRRYVLIRLIRAICTPSSVVRKLNH